MRRMMLNDLTYELVSVEAGTILKSNTWYVGYSHNQESFSGISLKVEGVGGSFLHSIYERFFNLQINDIDNVMFITTPTGSPIDLNLRKTPITDVTEIESVSVTGIWDIDLYELKRRV